MHPLLNHSWLTLHILTSSLGILLLSVASCFSFAYLIQERRLKLKTLSGSFDLPSLEMLDLWHMRMLFWGLAVFTLGVVVGLLKAKLNFDQIWTLSGWGIYVFIFSARVKTGLRGRRAALYSLLGFCLVAFFALRHGWLS
jgi:ABC-type uncharacterized transport system permease subunit